MGSEMCIRDRFGASDKAARVIPNKLFQQIAMGKPVLTRSSPAVDQLSRDFPLAVMTVPPDDPHALADSVAHWMADRSLNTNRPAKSGAILTLQPCVARLLGRLADQTLEETRTGSGS